ncbi:glycerol acyltransferase [Halobacillus fulvus]|nr:glycerol acyltransferase [Halobacillus fulvus]
MLPANKHPLIEWGFTRFNRIFLKKHFESIYLWKPSGTIPSKNTLFLINHSTWWDPLMIFYLNDQIIQSDGYGMMHEDGIQRHPFFRRIGAFSIKPEDRKHLIASLKYSTTLLNEQKTVWMFPQGEEQHLEKRPLHFFSGAAYLAQNASHVNVVPITLYYSLEHTRKPNAYIRIGEAIEPDDLSRMKRKELTEFLERVMTNQLNELKETIVSENHQGFLNLFKKH